jgi:hypothetical protein
MATARKEISREEKDGTETIKNEIIHFDIPPEIEQALNFIFDDYEYGQDHGVFVDSLDRIHTINVEDMLEELHDRIENDPDNSFMEKVLIDFFEKYEGFTVWV